MDMAESTSRDGARELKKFRFRGMEGFAEAARRVAAEEAAMLNYDGKGKPVN
jgi:hypothetical protein